MGVRVRRKLRRPYAEARFPRAYTFLGQIHLKPRSIIPRLLYKL